ncbi:ATP-binding protein [Maricaulis sp.]|uniref:ATP-binding protein n=1 Tax=unclassified Maricaulis TaxID=2632371 RepID=UPI001B207C7D|nr:ATP-binding protein [Maricaulis sp.]MBO6795686.1 ATP-binding protein [Maricaulis sp.]
MDPVRNPFAPGAGSQPPELAGRQDIISSADIALQRVLLGRHDRSQILLGLRGTGKTVLLNTIERMAEDHGHATSFVEAPEHHSLAQLLYPKIHRVLRTFSLVESARAAAHTAMKALQSFAGTFKIEIGDFSLSVDSEPGVADSGVLSDDITDLFLRVGETARHAARGWTLLIDEVQYLEEKELSALIVALHRINQKRLPVLLFGAGLPQLAALSGDAKSYAERLFDFPETGPLSPEATRNAIRQPILSEGENITDAALDLVVEETGGYPYFLQEWGYQAWNCAAASPITPGDIETANTAALKRLDNGFFRVRYDRLTPKEKEYVRAMASLGPDPIRSIDVAKTLGETAQALGPRRAQIINKGMIYSPAHGKLAFTVPMFGDYLHRRDADN